MNSYELFNILQQYKSVMEFNRGCSESTLEEFQYKNGIRLPKSLVDLLKCFDGGELFIPGTVIYGTGINGGVSLKEANKKEKRSMFNIPQSYLIFAKINYGDFLCIDLNGKNEVIQWDHELNEEFCKWDSLESWLSETIDNSDK